MTDKNCLHLHLTRIANMDLGSFHSSPTQGVFRCEECRDIFKVTNIEPYQIVAVYGTPGDGEPSPPLHTEALKAIEHALHDDKGDFWQAREFLDKHGRFNDNLEGNAILLEVAQVALLESGAAQEVSPPSLSAVREFRLSKYIHDSTMLSGTHIDELLSEFATTFLKGENNVRST